MNISFFWK